MRVILFTGKGGVGKTTVAAATGVSAAARGHRTLVLSTDPAHSLADALAHPLDGQPVAVGGGLFGHQVDGQRRFEQTWRDVQRYLLSVLQAAGVEPLEAEELTVLPGAEEVLALVELRDQVRSGRWDVVVVDCAPTAETLRLLALPEALGWYVDRLFPLEKAVARALRPMLPRAAGVPLPGAGVVEAAWRLRTELKDVRQLLTEPGSASVRLVLTPEAVVVAEARRTLTTLSLYGYRVDAVVANRVFPRAGGDDWRSNWVAAQDQQLAEVVSSFAPLPVYRAGYRAREPVGLADLAELASDIYRDGDPLAGPPGPEPLRVRRDGGDFELALSLPQAERGQLRLARSGDDLVITVDGHRRLLALPSGLRRCRVTGARLRDGELAVRFQPDPALWPAR